MEVQKLTGRSAGVLKYDLLTALSVAALAGPPKIQTSILRLLALVTARYNWQLDEVCVGQRDIARMWSVNERTVKREMKRLIQSGILLCKRQGVRGRVGAYTLNYSRIAEFSRDGWSLVGPDFDARMRDRYDTSSAKVVALRDFQNLNEESEHAKPRGTWAAAMTNLAAEAPGVFQAWLSKVAFVRYHQQQLYLRAPSTFVQRYVETHYLPLVLRYAEPELGIVDQIVFETQP